MGYLRSICPADPAGFGQASINRCFCPMYPQSAIDKIRDNQGQWLPGVQVGTQGRLQLALKTFQILVVLVHDIVFQADPDTSVSQGIPSSFSGWWMSTWMVLWPSAPRDFTHWFDSETVIGGASMAQIATCGMLHLYSTLWGVFWVLVVFVVFRFSYRIATGSFAIAIQTLGWTIEVAPLHGPPADRKEDPGVGVFPLPPTTVVTGTLLPFGTPIPPVKRPPAQTATEDPPGTGRLNISGGAEGLHRTLVRRHHPAHRLRSPEGGGNPTKLMVSGPFQV